MPRISAQEAAQYVAADQQRLNNSRRLPVTLDRIRILMLEEAFPICNVGPWLHQIRRGPISFDIPGYDPATDDQKLGYAASVKRPVISRFANIANEDNFGWFEDDGHLEALDLIGVGFGLHPHNSLVQYGVFVPAGKLPTKDEIAAAKAQLMAYRDRLIQEAREAYDKGPAERAAVLSGPYGERCIWAARSAGLNEAWVHGRHTQESVQCSSCGRFNPSGVAKCQCGMIIDFELHFKNEAEQRRRLKEFEDKQLAELEVQTRPGKK